ncbi:hypothetical protein V5799_018858 [Amblyomma americanum]|uniref:Uncharacterized protein n=1 Tax=Amblyomma americanum TaxID=6943 RepID=A0AAQ4EYV7_AMBAM
MAFPRALKPQQAATAGFGERRIETWHSCEALPVGVRRRARAQGSVRRRRVPVLPKACIASFAAAVQPRKFEPKQRRPIRKHLPALRKSLPRYESFEFPDGTGAVWRAPATVPFLNSAPINALRSVYIAEHRQELTQKKHLLVILHLCKLLAHDKGCPSQHEQLVGIGVGFRLNVFIARHQRVVLLVAICRQHHRGPADHLGILVLDYEACPPYRLATHRPESLMGAPLGPCFIEDGIKLGDPHQNARVVVGVDIRRNVIIARTQLIVVVGANGPQLHRGAAYHLVLLVLDYAARPPSRFATHQPDSLMDAPLGPCFVEDGIKLGAPHQDARVVVGVDFRRNVIIARTQRILAVAANGLQHHRGAAVHPVLLVLDYAARPPSRFATHQPDSLMDAPLGPCFVEDGIKLGAPHQDARVVVGVDFRRNVIIARTQRIVAVAANGPQHHRGAADHPVLLVLDYAARPPSRFATHQPDSLMDAPLGPCFVEDGIKLGAPHQDARVVVGVDFRRNVIIARTQRILAVAANGLQHHRGAAVHPVLLVLDYAARPPSRFATHQPDSLMDAPLGPCFVEDGIKLGAPHQDARVVVGVDFRRNVIIARTQRIVAVAANGPQHHRGAADHPVLLVLDNTARPPSRFAMYRSCALTGAVLAGLF